MNIDEASKITSISKDMIRYYEKIGLISPRRKDNRYRDFTEDDLNTLVVIKMLSNSHVPLKQIRSAFQTDSVLDLIAGLSTELETIHRIQNQIISREHAVKIEIELMQQYYENRNPVLCHYPDRWAVMKSSRVDNSFHSEYQNIANADDYYRYVACYDITFNNSASAHFTEQGILLYRPLPGSKLIPAQDCLRFIATHEAGRMLNEDELISYAKLATAYSEEDHFLVLASQFFRCMGHRDDCVVCVEVLLGQNHAMPDDHNATHSS